MYSLLLFLAAMSWCATVMSFNKHT